MNEAIMPKWQRELGSFLGIESGIILERNIYDEYPMFMVMGQQVEYLGTDDLDNTIMSIADADKSEIIFFDPIDGFYCYYGDVEEQKKVLDPLLEKYDVVETMKNHGCTVALMPVGEKKSKDDRNEKSRKAETHKYIWASEVVRDSITDFGRQIPEENGNEPKFVRDNIIFVLNFASRLKDCNLRLAESDKMFLNLMAATTAVQKTKIDKNSLIMIVDKYNDIPAWVYLNNPNIHTISIGLPDRAVRRMYLEKLCKEFGPYKVLGDADNITGKRFIAETEGLKLQEIKQILQLAYKKQIAPEDISTAFRLYKYGVQDNPWDKLESDIVDKIEENLEKRVKGQSEALEKVKTVAMRAVVGLSGLQHSGASHKPRGILFFAGPTGVGKTETAKALAESIFGDENACIRFDMSEYREAHSDQKMFGAPPGYVGYECGGQLTNAIKERPFSVILFDEIEKASPTIMDKFLQILEDGRMTDNQGNTVYFGESIIIFTSNIGLTKDDDENSMFSAHQKKVPTISIEDPEVEDTNEFRQRVSEILTNGVKDYFTDIGRPELLNRLGDDNIVVFQFINKHDAEIICDYKLKSICDSVKSDKSIVVYTDDATDFLHRKAVLERANGGRGVGNMLEREFLNPLSRFLCTLSTNPSQLRCFENEDSLKFEVI